MLRFPPFLRFSFLGRPHQWAAPLLVLLSACSGLRFIPEGAKLYTGGTIKLTSPAPIPNEKLLKTELAAVITPKPNGSILGMRPKLYFWHLGQGKTKGLGKFLADRYGEPPVLLKEVSTKKVEALLVNRLENNGYFKATAAHQIKEKGKTASIDYTATVGRQYRIKEIHFPDRDTLLDADIRATQGESLLKVGDAYNLNTFTNERIRIDNELKNKGYYYFAPEYLLFQVDSTLDNQVNVYLKVKGTIPRRAGEPYVLHRVTLNTDYILNDTVRRKPIMYQGYRYFPDEKVFKARAITRAVFIYPDSLYRRRRADQTLSRLMSLGTFKFVDMRFRPALAGDSAGIGRLDAQVLMTQVKKKSLRAELQAVSKENGFVGPGLHVQFRNRSALLGAEQLLIDGVASFENQTKASATTIGVTSYEIGGDAQLLVPRFIAPFDIRLKESDFQPRTNFGVGYKYVQRQGAFQEDIFHLNYGYSWKLKVTNEQELKPVDLQYTRLGTTTKEFDQLLLDRPFLANSFRQQFILGSGYRYTYNQQVLEKLRNQVYFSGGLDVSGNLAYGLGKLGVVPKDSKGYYTVFGQEFSQFTKLDLELRNYYRISPDPASGNKIATRLLIGVGLPYLNSKVLPYLKQYGIGGPNSVRAFAARSIGPGKYRPTTTSEKSSNFYDQVGDLRLEANAEYRQDLAPYVKGAVFIDAGNIWLVNRDDAREGGEFKPASFLQQLAVGAGVGLRIDVQFFVIRADLAFPLRAPYGTPTDKKPRLNIAIGYPF